MTGKFVCEHEGCGKAFNRRDYLDRHAANHLEVKPYHCATCDRYFARHDLYDNHLQTKLHVKRTNELSQGQGVTPIEAISGPSGSSSWSRLESNRQDFPSGFLPTGDSTGTPSDNIEIDEDLASKDKKRRRRVNRSYPSPASSGNETNAAMATGQFDRNNGASNGNIAAGSQRNGGRPPPALALNGIPSFNGINSGNSDNNHVNSHPESQPENQQNYTFSWLFDDQDPTPYDALYSRYNDMYWNNAMRLDDDNNHLANRKQYAPTVLSHNMCERIRTILDPLGGCEPALSNENIGYYIDLMWGYSEALQTTVHRPTFDAEEQAPETLATIVVVGMSVSRNHQLEELAQALYSRVFVAIKNALSHAACDESRDVLSYAYSYEISLFVAICLLMRYESHIMGGETDGPYCVASGKWLIEKFMWYLVPQAGVANKTNRPGVTGSSIKFGRLEEDGYYLFEPPSHIINNEAEYHSYLAAQWKEWARYESSKRTALCALFCDAVHKLENGKGSSPLTIFDLNCHMPAPEVLWNAQTFSDFLAIVGNDYDGRFGQEGGETKIIRAWSYLKTIKSMLRFPSLAAAASSDALSASMVINPYVTPTTPSGHKQQYPWPLFTLNAVIYGLLTVARCINSPESDFTFQDTEIGRRLNSMWTVADAQWRMDVDRGILLRLARGFDKWAQVFEFSSTGGAGENAGESHYPFTVPESNALHIENFNIVGQMAKQIGSGAFLEFVLLILLNYHSAMMMMNEEVRLVAVFANRLPFYLADHSPRVSQSNSYSNSFSQTPEQDPQTQLLMAFANYIPANEELSRWRRNAETKRLVTCACLFLVRVTRAKRLLDRDRVENLILGMVTYYSVLILWMYKGNSERCAHVPSTDTLVIEQATQYLHRVWCETAEVPDSAGDLSPSTANGPAVVVALGAWLLRGIPIGKEQTGGQILHALYSSLIPTRNSSIYL